MGTLRYWSTSGATPSSHSEVLMLAHSLAQSGSEGCEGAASVLEDYSPTEAALVRGICVARRPDGDIAQAVEEFATGMMRLREDPWANSTLVIHSLLAMDSLYPRLPPELLEKLADSISSRFSLSMVEELRMQSDLVVSRGIDGDRCGTRTMRALHAFEPFAPFREETLKLRASCYEATKDSLAELAKRDYEAYLTAKDR